MCCGQGTVIPVAQTLLARLADAGVPLPDGARVGLGRGRGWRWRILDAQGQEPPVPVGSSCLARSVLQGDLRAVESGGAIHIHGSEPCAWGR